MENKKKLTDIPIKERHVHIYKVSAMKEATIVYDTDEQFKEALQEVIDDPDIPYKKADKNTVSVWPNEPPIPKNNSGIDSELMEWVINRTSDEMAEIVTGLTGYQVIALNMDTNIVTLVLNVLKEPRVFLDAVKKYNGYPKIYSEADTGWVIKLSSIYFVRTIYGLMAEKGGIEV